MRLIVLNNFGEQESEELSNFLCGCTPLKSEIDKCGYHPVFDRIRLVDLVRPVNISMSRSNCKWAVSAPLLVSFIKVVSCFLRLISVRRGSLSGPEPTSLYVRFKETTVYQKVMQ